MIIQPSYQTFGERKALVIEACAANPVPEINDVDSMFSVKVILSGPDVVSDKAACKLVAGLDYTIAELRRTLRDLVQTRVALADGGQLLGLDQKPTPEEPPTEADLAFSASLHANRDALRAEQRKDVDAILKWARQQIFDASNKPHLHKLYISVPHEVGRLALIEMAKRSGLQAFGCPSVKGGYSDSHVEYKTKTICSYHVCVHLPEL